MFLAVVAGVSVAVVLTNLTIGDVFASALAIIPTGWGLLSVSNHRSLYVHSEHRTERFCFETSTKISFDWTVLSMSSASSVKFKI